MQRTPTDCHRSGCSAALTTTTHSRLSRHRHDLRVSEEVREIVHSVVMLTHTAFTVHWFMDDFSCLIVTGSGTAMHSDSFVVVGAI